MNKEKISLYKVFLEVDFLLSSQIFNFIKDSCPVANKTIKENRIKTLTLLDNYFPESSCNDCTLCTKDGFIYFYKKLREYKNNIKAFHNPLIITSEIEKQLKPARFLYDLDFKNKKLTLIDDYRNEEYLSKINFKQEILLSFYLDIKNILDVKKYLYQEKKYFKQIAVLLLNCNDFISGIEKIRDSYYVKVKIKGQPANFIYERKDRELLKDENIFNKYNDDVNKFMQKFKLSARWRPYIVITVLKYPVDKDRNLVIPKGETPQPPPSGFPGTLLSFVPNGIISKKLLLAGDERLKDIRSYVRKHDIKDSNYKKLKLRRTPMTKFSMCLRWYKEYQKLKLKYEKDRIRDKEGIYNTIFSDDITAHPEDWTRPHYEKYIQSKNPNSDVKLTSIEEEDIDAKGVSTVRRKIYYIESLLYDCPK